MLLTLTGERLYIRFDLKEASKIPSEPQVEARGLQSDMQLVLRFTPQWNICGYARLPDPESFFNKMLVSSVYNAFFGLHYV